METKMLQNLKEGQKVTRYGNVDWSEELFMATTHTGTATFWSIVTTQLNINLT